MTARKSQFRKIHRAIAPIMILPIVLTLITGMLYQLVDLTHRADQFDWLLDWHKGHFGPLNLEVIYPFLNGLGLLLLAGTGIALWLRSRRQAPRDLG